MAKKQVTVSLRRPKQAEARGGDADLAIGALDVPTLADVFVDSTVARAPVVVPASFGSPPSTIAGRVAVTVQLPSELASRLLVRCLDDDRDASNVVAGLVREWLEGESREPEVRFADVVRWARKAILDRIPFVGMPSRS